MNMLQNNKDRHPELASESHDSNLCAGDSGTASGVAASFEESPAKEEPRPASKPDPVRYGDWEKNGRCIDF